MSDETYGIGQDNRPDLGQFDAAQGWVQRGEQLVGREDFRVGHAVE